MQHAIEGRVEQRLLAEPVAGEQQAPLPQVANRKREHAVEVIDAVVAVLFVGVNDRFGVGLGAELMAAGLELAAQFAVVIDFAVEDDPDGSVFVGHRLLASGPVDDGQSPVTESEPRSVKVAAAIGSPVAQAFGHPFDGPRHMRWQVAFKTDYAADSAHAST